MATVIATTHVWMEPNPNSDVKEGYDPLHHKAQYALEPGCCPCDDCPQRAACRDDGMACDVYDEWLNPWKEAQRGYVMNHPRVPTQHRFKKSCS